MNGSNGSNAATPAVSSTEKHETVTIYNTNLIRLCLCLLCPSISLKWRTFNFFTAQQVADRLEPGQTPQAFRSSPEVSTITAGQGHVVVADIHGSLSLCNADLEATKTWIAHPNGRVTHMKFAGTKGLLVTIGEEETSPHPILKIWNTRHDDRKTGAPRLLVSGRIPHASSSSRSHPVSTLAITPTLSLTAVGYADGTVQILRQLDQYIQSGSASSSAGPAGLPKPKLVHSSPSNPITGLGFRLPSASAGLTNTITNTLAQPAGNTAGSVADGPITLFIVTTHQILTYATTPTGRALTGASAHATVMDDVGAALNCTAMLVTGEMVLAKDEAIFVYGPEGRGQSYFYEGSKSAIASYLNYIIITSPPFMPSASSQSATVRNFMRDQRNSGNSTPSFNVSTDIAKVTIFDPENKFVAYSGAFPEGVREVFCEWGEIFILTNDGKLSRLVEKPTPEKLGVLFLKNLYLLAINLARSSGLEEGEIADIHKKYGDHLYDKGDFDGAMQQFIKTIGKVQPSYVIRKFLDGQRINNLTSYLQELHTQNLANSDITTLLLNCYAKLKDTARLDEFIETAAPSATGELPFDLETAIRVCRQAGYYDHAVSLARKFDQPEEYLRIQVEDREQWADAVAYIRTLGQEDAERNLRRYGKTLLEKIPEQATDLFVDLCCGTLDRPSVEAQAALAAAAGAEKEKTGGNRSSYLSYLALNRKGSSGPTTITESVNTATINGTAPQAAMDGNAASDGDNRISAELDALKLDQPDLPNVRQFFALFVDQPSSFIRFLETIAKRRWSRDIDEPAGAVRADASGDEDEEAAIWNTLLELYLAESSAGESNAAMQEKASKILNNIISYPVDPTQALLVCTMADFVPGILAVYEHLGMYEDILRFWMDQTDSLSSSSQRSTDSNGQQAKKPIPSEQVIATLDKFGPQGHAELYPLALRYLTSDAALIAKHQKDLLRVLDHIDAEKLMPPIAVIQALSRTGVATVGLVKEYLRKQISTEQEEVDADRALTESYRTDINRKEREIAELSDPRAPRIFQVTRCSACGGSLDLPAVHFMCRHSYHQRCLADNEGSCPSCASQQGVVMEIKQANENLRGRHDLFMEELEEADDRFESVVSAFGRGLVRPVEG